MNLPETKTDPTVYSSGLSIWQSKVRVCTPKSRTFHEKCSQVNSCSFWAALPGAQPWKGLRPQESVILYDSQSLLRSQSNSVSEQIHFKSGPEQSQHFDQKNEFFSKTRHRILSGSIFHPRLARELSRNASVVSILFPERISSRSEDFLHDSKKSKFS